MLTSPRDVLDLFVLVFIFRIALSTTRTYDYADPQLLDWLQKPFALTLLNAAGSHITKNDITVATILRLMKLNFFPTDPVTVAIAAMLRENKGQRTINTYIFSLCCSRLFVAAFRASKAFAEEKTMIKKLHRTWDWMGGHMSQSFSMSFNPQRRWMRTLTKLPDRQAREKFLNSITKKPAKIHTKDTEAQLMSSCFLFFLVGFGKCTS